MIKGIIFDADGVIIQSEDTHCEAYQRVFLRHGYDLSEAQYKQYFSGKTIRSGVEAFVRGTGFVTLDKLPDLLEQITAEKIFASYQLFEAGEVPFYQDTVDFILNIRSGNCRLNGIGDVTSKPTLAVTTGLERRLLEAILGKPPLASVKFITVTSDDYATGKPDPECYVLTLDRMGLAAADVVGIEDSRAGVQALLAAGIPAIGLATTHSRDELSGARRVVSSLSDLIA